VVRDSKKVAAFVQAAALLGIPVYVWTIAARQDDYAMLVLLFVPGLFMLATAFLVALAAAIVARPGFVRAQALDSLRFHAIVLAVVAVLLPALIAAFAVGVMVAAQTIVLLFGVALTLIEIARSFVCGVGALRSPTNVAAVDIPS
jgi:hypothetical protein